MATSTEQHIRTELVSFHSPSLEGNSLGVSPQREMCVHLPPGYFAGADRYPVIYLLHGYGADARHPIVASDADLTSSFPVIFRIRNGRLFRQVLTFERLDELMLVGQLPPFILVQPDGSLHLDQISGERHPDGVRKLKGSMYYDSPGTGKFGQSVFLDAVDEIDRRYRTVAVRSHRGVVGGSMGGYGALLAGIFHADRFSAVAALSPSICGLDVMDTDLFVPFQRWRLGRAGAVRAGRGVIADILDTCDMVFSPDRPLMPTVERGADRRAIRMDETARANWAAADAGVLAGLHVDAFSNVAVRVSCEEQDEFGFAGPDRRFCTALAQRQIDHELNIFNDRMAARISSHAAGIALQVVPGLKFCLARMVVSGS